MRRPLIFVCCYPQLRENAITYGDLEPHELMHFCSDKFLGGLEFRFSNAKLHKSIQYI